MAQINPTVGAIDANVELIRASIRAAEWEDVQLLVVPELAVSGYPPEDLLLRDDFLAACAAGVERVAAAVAGMVVCVGSPHRRAGRVRNSLHVLQYGRVRGVYDKVHLPNYGVFDERRYFRPGPGAALVRVGDELIGLTICEDAWLPGDPLAAEAAAGARLVVNLERVAVPPRQGRGAREDAQAARARSTAWRSPTATSVGGQDELVFDGGSFVCDHTGGVLARAAQFDDRAARVRHPLGRLAAAGSPVGGQVSAAARRAPSSTSITPGAAAAEPARPRLASRWRDEAEVYAALVLGTRDYVGEERLRATSCWALSGGVDSALVAGDRLRRAGRRERAPASHALAATRRARRRTTRAPLAARPRRCAYAELPIDGIVEPPTHATLAEDVRAAPSPASAEENIQARIRGNLLMALSNKFGWLVLTTGNKSEIGVGYATLYGDMAGGFAVIKDVPKTLVYRLARWPQRDAGARRDPRAIIERPPSAELRPTRTTPTRCRPYDAARPDPRGLRRGRPVRRRDRGAPASTRRRRSG